MTNSLSPEGFNNPQKPQQIPQASQKPVPKSGRVPPEDFEKTANRGGSREVSRVKDDDSAPILQIGDELDLSIRQATATLTHSGNQLLFHVPPSSEGPLSSENELSGEKSAQVGVGQFSSTQHLPDQQTTYRAPKPLDAPIQVRSGPIASTQESLQGTPTKARGDAPNSPVLLSPNADKPFPTSQMSSNANPAHRLTTQMGEGTSQIAWPNPQSPSDVSMTSKVPGDSRVEGMPPQSGKLAAPPTFTSKEPGLKVKPSQDAKGNTISHETNWMRQSDLGAALSQHPAPSVGDAQVLPSARSDQMPYEPALPLGATTENMPAVPSRKVATTFPSQSGEAQSASDSLPERSPEFKTSTRVPSQESTTTPRAPDGVVDSKPRSPNRESTTTLRAPDGVVDSKPRSPNRESTTTPRAPDGVVDSKPRSPNRESTTTPRAPDGPVDSRPRASSQEPPIGVPKRSGDANTPNPSIFRSEPEMPASPRPSAQRKEPSMGSPIQLKDLDTSIAPSSLPLAPELSSPLQTSPPIQARNSPDANATFGEPLPRKAPSEIPKGASVASPRAEPSRAQTFSDNESGTISSQVQMPKSANQESTSPAAQLTPPPFKESPREAVPQRGFGDSQNSRGAVAGSTSALPAATKGTERSRSSSEREDVSRSSNAPILPTANLTEVPLNANAPLQEPSAAERVQTAEQIIAQMVSAIGQLTQSDRTETVVTLNQPPHFKGVQLIVTEFNSARGELNLTFANVQSPEAQKWLADNRNQQTLKTNLLDVGYVVQHFETTHQQDMRVVSQDPNSFGQSQDQEGESSKQQQQTKPQRLFAETQDDT